jgi:Flp pilus assembly CpaE family ATPase
LNVARATTHGGGTSEPVLMTLRVALVAADDPLRLAMARAFQGAPAQWEVALHGAPPPDADVVVVGPETKLPGGVRFDVDHPEQALAEVEAAAVRAARVCVVASGSGGAGVTTLSLHLAAEFAAAGSTCVIDFDPRGGTAARLGLADGHLTWHDDAGIPVPGGFQVMPSPAEPRPEDFCAALDRAIALFDQVIVDVSVPVILETALAKARCGVLVLPPTVAGTRRARMLVERWPELDWAVVSNRTGPGGELTHSELEQQLGHRIALELACTAALRDAEDDCRLLIHRWSRFGRGVRKLAEALERL